MATINLLNTNVYIFIVIVVLGVIVISIYMMIKPEQNPVPYRFNPFPKIAPTDLPDPARATDNCWNKLTPCDQFGNCSACSGQEYKCTNVTKEQADSKHFHFNGINVPEGNWCLPKDNNPNPQCNQYTGRQLWVFDQEYCANKSSNGQCWKCECLYPNMFSSSEEGCTNRSVCQNNSISALSSTTGGQPTSQLKANFSSSNIQSGCVWDPTLPPSDNCSGIYQYTPYDQDKNGNPLFSCSCSSPVDNQYFTSLPNDPYSCHLDPCYKSSNYTSGGYRENEQCICQPNYTLSPGGKFKNTCVSVPMACGSSGDSAGYDSSTNSCLCGDEGPYWPRNCKSEVTGINTDKNYPNCKTPQNALGSECINPCEGVSCNLGNCLSCGPNSYENLFMCKLSSDWSRILSDEEASIPHSVCDCSNIKTNPDPSRYGGYFGPACASLCLVGGTKVREKWVWGAKSKTDTPCNNCCALSTYTETGTLNYETDEYCNSGFPSMTTPADPECLPPAGDA